MENIYIVIIDEIPKGAFNTEDKELWYEWGANQEVDFVNKIVPIFSRI